MYCPLLFIYYMLLTNFSYTRNKDIKNVSVVRKGNYYLHPRPAKTKIGSHNTKARHEFLIDMKD